MAQAKTVPMTPWVTRLLALNGAVFLLLATVFVSPRFLNALTLDPSAIADRPWTVVTYMFGHESLFQLALNSLVLYLFGPLVERRLGQRRFVLYYLYCGVGAALFGLAINAMYPLNPFIGSSGAVLGVSLAYVLSWPQDPITAFQVPMAAKTVFLTFLGLDLAVGLTGPEGIAHLAHLGGAFAGYAFFRLQSLTTSRPPTRPVSIRRPVVTPMRMQETPSDRRASAPSAVVESPDGSTDQDIDRLLDKISEFGIDSLTVQERQALSDAAERKRREQS